MLSKHLQTLNQTTIDLLQPRDVDQTAALFHDVVSPLAWYNGHAVRAMIDGTDSIILTAKYGRQ
jgi:hypothetical protein